MASDFKIKKKKLDEIVSDSFCSGMSEYTQLTNGWPQRVFEDNVRI